MMAPRTLDYWRKFFRSADADVFEIIERAILVAASDLPDEFAARRDGIAQTLFTCQLQRCAASEPRKPSRVGEEDGGGGRDGMERDVDRASNVASTSGQHEEEPNSMVSNDGYAEAEELSEMIEEACQIVGEVSRIKTILENKQGESDGVLLESLRRLQLMQLSVQTLQETEIGRTVNALRKHKSKPIRLLARTLITDWRALVDEWFKAAEAIQGGTPQSFNPSTLEEEEGGLEFPPLDEAALIAAQTTTIDLSKIFDGMDEEGNPTNYVGFEMSAERKPLPEMRDEWRHYDEVSMKVKLEASKRKLHERYEEAKKKQRTIQVIKPCDLPKPGGRSSNNHGR